MKKKSLKEGLEWIEENFKIMINFVPFYAGGEREKILEEFDKIFFSVRKQLSIDEGSNYGREGL